MGKQISEKPLIFIIYSQFSVRYVVALCDFGFYSLLLWQKRKYHGLERAIQQEMHLH
jgi:hypothetical protein